MKTGTAATAGEASEECTQRFRRGSGDGMLVDDEYGTFAQLERIADRADAVIAATVAFVQRLIAV